MARYAVILWFVLSLGAGTGATGCAAHRVDRAAGDETLKARVEAALAGAADVMAGAITVATRRGVVTLTGHVASPEEQQSAGAIVRAIPGVEDVQFSLTIAPPAQGEGR